MNAHSSLWITSLVSAIASLFVLQPLPAQDAKSEDAKAPKHVAKPVRDAWVKAGFEYGWRGDSVGYFGFVEDTGDNAAGEVPFFHLGEWHPGLIKQLPAPEQPFGLDLSDFKLGRGMLHELRGLAHLHSLYLVADEEFPGLEHLASLPRLHTILTIGGKATDQTFKDLGAIKSLRNLQIPDGDIGDSDLSPLKNVHTLFLPWVSVRGLKQLARLENVKDFGTYARDWSDAQLATLPRFKHVESLSLTGLTDTGLKQLSGLTNLRSLRVSYGKLTDTGVKQLAGLKDLRVLDLSYNEVTDGCLEHVAQLEKLEELNLYFNDINDGGLKHLARLKKLSSLDIANTVITDGAVKHLSVLKSLKYLETDSLTPAAKARLTKALPDVKFNTKPRRKDGEFAEIQWGIPPGA